MSECKSKREKVKRMSSDQLTFSPAVAFVPNIVVALVNEAVVTGKLATLAFRLVTQSTILGTSPPTVLGTFLSPYLLPLVDFTVPGIVFMTTTPLSIVLAYSESGTISLITTGADIPSGSVFSINITYIRQHDKRSTCCR